MAVHKIKAQDSRLTQRQYTIRKWLNNDGKEEQFIENLCVVHSAVK
jgi:DNA-binding winged helix-turn-helix (wHTH) protein